LPLGFRRINEERKMANSQFPVSSFHGSPRKRFFSLLILLLIGPLLLVLAFALTPDEQMQFADGLYLRGFYDMAVREYLIVVRDFPDYGKMDAALFRIAESYRHMDQAGGAIRFYKRVIKEYPESVYRFKSEFRRAELFVLAGQYRDAEKLFGALIKADPPPEIAASAWYYLGLCRDKLKEDVGAEEALMKVIRDYPDSTFFSYAALTLAEHYKRIGGHDAERKTLYARVAEKAATPRIGAEGCFQLADLAFASGDYSAAAEAYGRLMEVYPDDERVGEARLQAAWSYYRADRMKQAFELAEEALAQVKPEDEEQWLYLKANCQRGLNHPRDASTSYLLLLKKYPNGSTVSAASYESALIAFRNREYTNVIARLTGVDIVGPTEQDSDWLIAESYANLGRRDEARKYYEKILAGFGDANRAPLAAYRMARLYHDEDEFLPASVSYQKLVERYPESELAPLALYSSGLCLAQTGDHAGAVKDWEQLLKRYPDFEKSDEAMYRESLSLVQLGKHDKARDKLNALLKTFPKTDLAPDATYALGILYEGMGKWPDAEQAFRRVIKMAPVGIRLDQSRYRLALVLQHLDKNDEAADLLQNLLSTPIRKDMPPDLLEWLARYQLERGLPMEAVAAARALVKSSRKATWKQIGWFLAGEANRKAGKNDAAGKAFKKAVAAKAHTPEGARSALQLGELALSAGETKQARASFEDAARRAVSEELIAVRARSYYGLGQTALAETNLDAAARHFLGVAVLFDDPELSAESLYRAAESFGQLEQTEKRDKALKELKTRYPDSPWTKKTSEVEVER